PSRPLLSQRSRRRCRQRHPQRRRLQPSPRSRLAEDHFARHPTRATPDLHNSASPQTGFLTGDYGRYGFSIDEALDGPPAGVTPQPQASGLLRFDPFDQNLAERNLSETRDRLTQLYERMRAACPEYAEARSTPPSSAAKFVAALHACRGRVP